MKKTFPGYYRPTDEEFSNLWKDCLFVLDANVLLNLYRYSQHLSNELITIIKRISDRLWIPHQAALEFHKNRLNEIMKQKKAYEDIKEILDKAKNQIENDLNFYKRHPLIQVGSFQLKIRRVFYTIKKELDKQKKTHPDLIKDDYLDNDEIKNILAKYLDGKVGKPYTQEELEKKYKDGEIRYKRKIPPGYEDKKKEGFEKYGDLVLWCQIIDKAKQEKKPIIFVTDERKEDWWFQIEGSTVSPRPELIEEMLSKGGVPFYMYQTQRFMEFARDYLNIEVDQEAIDEVKELKQRDDEYMKAERERATALETLQGTSLLNAARSVLREKYSLWGRAKENEGFWKIAKENEGFWGKMDKEAEESSLIEKSILEMYEASQKTAKGLSTYKPTSTPKARINLKKTTNHKKEDKKNNASKKKGGDE
jgi:hypothetical protein